MENFDMKYKVIVLLFCKYFNLSDNVIKGGC